MQTIPLQTVPNQSIQAQLNNQNCTINVQQMSYGLFLTLYVGTTLIVAGAICENLVLIVRYAYAGFQGDLVFEDTQGTSDPVYTGIGGAGARYQLTYLLPSDLAALGFAG
jgi:hypothetical protein